MQDNGANQNQDRLAAENTQGLLGLLASQMPAGDTLNDVMYA